MSVYARRRIAVAVAALVVLAGAGYGVDRAVHALRGGERATIPPAPAPPVVVRRAKPQAAQDLGFPAFATKNTTRVAGADPVADAAGVALAVFPSAGGVEGPSAVTLVDGSDWASAIAASVLAGPPVRAPILISGSGQIPDLTGTALEALAPSGSSATDGEQVFAIGDAASPQGVRTERVKGSTPAQIADSIDELRQKLTGSQPDAILLASSSQAPFAMPAAAWAARSGDPVLFLQRGSVPKPTLAALARHKGVPVYVLGPSSVISDKTLGEVRKVAPGVQRIAGEDPVANAIAFARYSQGTFGWNINDPGHGFVIANDDRPLDAAAAAPLSASGDWGPLLLTDSADTLPPALRGYLLDVEPGYLHDPTRAVYNHVWLIGDESAMSVDFQAQVDALAEVVPVRSGSGPPPIATPAPTPPSTPHHQQP